MKIEALDFNVCHLKLEDSGKVTGRKGVVYMLLETAADSDHIEMIRSA